MLLFGEVFFNIFYTNIKKAANRLGKVPVAKKYQIKIPLHFGRIIPKKRHLMGYFCCHNRGFRDQGYPYAGICQSRHRTHLIDPQNESWDKICVFENFQQVLVRIASVNHGYKRHIPELVNVNESRRPSVKTFLIELSLIVGNLIF